MIEVCVNCRYFVPVDSVDQLGFCYFNPPSCTVIDQEESSIVMNNRPYVNEFEFCSQFKNREQDVVSLESLAGIVTAHLELESSIEGDEKSSDSIE